MRLTCIKDKKGQKGKNLYMLSWYPTKPGRPAIIECMQAYCAEVCWPFGCGMAPLVAANRPALCMYRANGGGFNTTLLIPKTS